MSTGLRILILGMAIAMSQGGGQNQVSWCGEDFEKYEVLLEALVVLLLIEMVLYSIFP